MTTVYRAAWVCPIAGPPVRHGWVAVANGRIAAVGGHGEAPPGPPRELGNVAVLPGLVNAHTHVELSWLRGRVPPAASFLDWVRQMFAVRGRPTDRVDDPEIIAAATAAAREMRECGIAAVGDISNSLASIGPIRDAGLAGVVFHELLGFNVVDDGPVVASRARRIAAAEQGGDAVRVSIAPHAPYSVSAELFRAIHDEALRCRPPLSSVHLAESESEVALLHDGSGPWPGMLRWVGAFREEWSPPGMTPVEYLASVGVLHANMLVVHAVHVTRADLDRLAALGCTVVTCPRSNQWVGAGAPPVDLFYEAGVRVAVGTDSLASVGDLNLFEELRAMHWLAPRVPASQLLESATRRGAEALGLGADLGTIEPGKRAELIAITLPAELPSEVAVEEHLVSGVPPRDIAWLAP